MTPKTLFTTLLAAAAMTFAVGAQRSNATDIVQNGGFETPGATTTGAADWNSLLGIGAGAAGAATVVTNPTAAHSGNNYMQLSATGSSLGGANVQAVQTTAVGSVTPGTVYTLSLYESGAFQASDVGNYSLTFFDANNNNLGGGLNTNFFSTAPTYTNLTATATAPTNASYATLSLGLSAGAVPSATPGLLNFDDVSLSSPGGGTIPEPATLALLGIGGVALLRRKRVA